MFGFITKVYDPPVPDSRLKRVSTSAAASRNAASWPWGTPSTLNRVGSTPAKVTLVSPLASTASCSCSIVVSVSSRSASSV